MPHLLSWQLRTKTLTSHRLPLIMGVLNVTPDSFSDGGRFFDSVAAVEHGLRLAVEGADILDIGGQSTRPGAEPVSPEEELRRVSSVVASLAAQLEIPISIDTSNAFVAREALAAGAEAINDITALTGDLAMLELARSTSCGICAMHMRGNPQTMQRQATYGDVVEEVRAWLAARRDGLVAAGIDPSRIALDPGIGFGKTAEHNLTLLRSLSRFRDLGCPLLVGVSRKAFIGRIVGDPNADRTAGTIGAVLSAARCGVEIVRVHDVAAVRHALMAFEATGGMV